MQTARIPTSNFLILTHRPHFFLRILVVLCLGYFNAGSLGAKPAENDAPESQMQLPGNPQQSGPKTDENFALTSGGKKVLGKKELAEYRRKKLDNQLLNRTIDQLDRSELEAILEREGLNTQGSELTLRLTLKKYLGVLEDVNLPRNAPTGGLWESAEPAPGPGVIKIENASEGDWVEIDNRKEGLLRLRGRVKIRMGTRTVEADLLMVNIRTSEIYGEGNIVLAEGELKVTGEKFIYDNRTGQGVVYEADTYLKPIYYLGRKIKKTGRDKFLIDVGYFTSCKSPRPHYTIKASSVWVYSENKVVAVNVIYYSGGVPVFWLPIALTAENGTSIVTQYGHNRFQGHFVQNTFHLGIPGSKGRWLVPDRFTLKYDWYQLAGQYAGVELHKKERHTLYDINLGLAKYKYRQLIPNFANNGASTVFTNYLRGPNDTTYERDEIWFGTTADINKTIAAKYESDTTAQVIVKFENYSHQDFVREYTWRNEPKTTTDMFFRRSPQFPGTGANRLNWEADYSESWGSTQFNMNTRRTLVWREKTAVGSSEYEPLYELLPRFRVAKREQITNLTDYQNLWWQGSLDGDIERSYTEGEIKRTGFYGHFQNGLFTIFSFPAWWLSYTPMAGYGMQKQFAKSDDDFLHEENGRQSFQFLFTNNTLRFGPWEASLTGTHLYRYTFAEEVEDPTFGDTKLNRIILRAETHPIPGINADVSSGRDFRELPYEIAEEKRWDDIVANGQVYIDFFKPFREDYTLLTRHRTAYFMGLDFTDTYIYHTPLLKSQINSFNTRLVSGRFTIPAIGIKEVELMGVGFTWYHSYRNLSLSQMRFHWMAAVWFDDLWKLTLGANSRAEGVERYDRSHPDYIPFHKDLATSINLFDTEGRKNSIFNLENFYMTLQHDLHAWLLELSYYVNRRNVKFGPNNRNVFSFYDQLFYFSLTLKDMSGAGIPRSQIYRYSPEDELRRQGLQ